MMVMAQITDPHIGQNIVEGVDTNLLRLQTVLSDLAAMQRQPDFYVLTGDLCVDANPNSYQKLDDMMTKQGKPWFAGIGNHDDRAVFASVFGDDHLQDGFLQYSIDDWPVRVLVIDTVNNGRHSGAFCEKRAGWLRAKLKEQPDRPTLIAMHHPPIHPGIAWLTPANHQDWANRLKEIVQEFSNIIQIIAGHVHLPISGTFANTPVSVCRAIAPQTKLELAPINPDIADGRALIVDELPGYCLHHWDGKSLTIFHGTSPAGAPIVSFDEEHQFIVRTTMEVDESPSG